MPRVIFLAETERGMVLFFTWKLENGIFRFFRPIKRSQFIVAQSLRLCNQSSDCLIVTSFNSIIVSVVELEYDGPYMAVYN